MRMQELAHGHAYTEGGVTIIFRHGSALAPQYLFGDTPVTIDAPERYGAWETMAERTQYVRAFIADRVVTEQRPLIVSDAFYAKLTQRRPITNGSVIPEAWA